MSSQIRKRKIVQSTMQLCASSASENGKFEKLKKMYQRLNYKVSEFAKNVNTIDTLK